MNTDTYISLLGNPESLTKEQLGQLAVVIDQYPYFQSARALQLKGLKTEGSFLYNDALKTTAAYTTDRDILFEYITSENFVQNEISEIILQQSENIRELEVVHEDISKEVDQEIEQQHQVEIRKAEAILNPKLFERKEEKPSLPEKEKEHPETKEDILQIDAPLKFTQQDTRSFGEWLKLTQAKPIEREEEEEEEEEEVSSKEKIQEIEVIDEDEILQKKKNRKFELIEKFIQDRPKIVPSDHTTKNINLAKPYTQASDTLMTETLAKVYLQQKNYKKAIQAYKILILKNPEKSGFFADQIRAIQKLIKTEDS